MTMDSDDGDDSVGENRNSGGSGNSGGRMLSRDSSNSVGSNHGDGGYVKSTAMANFYYRKDGKGGSGGGGGGAEIA